jgi:hypothetical protein
MRLRFKCQEMNSLIQVLNRCYQSILILSATPQNKVVWLNNLITSDFAISRHEHVAS